MAIFEIINALIAKTICCICTSQNWCQAEKEIKTDAQNNSEDTNESKETITKLVIKNKNLDKEFKPPQSGEQLSNESETSTDKSTYNTAPMAKSAVTNSSQSRDSSNCRYQTANDESTSLADLPKKLKKNYPLTSTKVHAKCKKKKNFRLKKIFAKCYQNVNKQKCK